MAWAILSGRPEALAEVIAPFKNPRRVYAAGFLLEKWFTEVS